MPFERQSFFPADGVKEAGGPVPEGQRDGGFVGAELAVIDEGVRRLDLRERRTAVRAPDARGTVSRERQDALALPVKGGPEKDSLMSPKREEVLIALLEKTTPFPVSSRFRNVPDECVGPGEIAAADVRVQETDLGHVGRVFGLRSGLLGLVLGDNRGIPCVFGQQTLGVFAVSRLVNLVIGEQGKREDDGRGGPGDVQHGPVLPVIPACKFNETVPVGPHERAGLEPFDLIRQFPRRLVTLPGILAQGLFTDAYQFRGRVGFLFEDGRHDLHHHPSHGFAGAVRPKRRGAGEKFIQDDAQGVYVRPFVDFFRNPLGLFGRHVFGGAHCLPFLRFRKGCWLVDKAPGGIANLLFERILGLGFDLGEPPVKHDGLAEFSDHHIGGFDVAMEDAAAMGVCDGFAQVDEMGEEREAFIEIGARAQGAGQGTAAYQFHRVVQVPAFPAADFVYGHDRRVFEAGGNPAFLQETRRYRGGVSHGTLFREDHARVRSGEQLLERDVAPHLDVVSQKDSSHASASMLRRYGVAPGDLMNGVDQRGLRELKGGVPHRGGCPAAGGGDGARRVESLPESRLAPERVQRGARVALVRLRGGVGHAPNEIGLFRRQHTRLRQPGKQQDGTVFRGALKCLQNMRPG